MENPSPLVVGQEFVRQYYKVLNEAPAFLHRFYGNKSSYVHGGLDPNGKLAEAVYEPKEIHKKVMSLQFSECCAEISHVNAHAMLGDGVMVQVLGELSNSGQPMRKFMQTFVLAPDGLVGNKFYVHHDIFRYEDEVFGDSHAELQEKSEKNVEEEPKERQPSPEPLQESPNSTTYYEPHPVTNEVEEPMEEPAPEPKPEPEPEPKAEELKPEREKKVLEEIKEKAQSPVPVESPPNTQEAHETSSWTVMTNKKKAKKEKKKEKRNAGTVTPSGIPPHVVKATQPEVESQSEMEIPLHPKDLRTRNKRRLPPRGPKSDGVPSESQTGKPHLSSVNKAGGRDGKPGVMNNRRILQYPDSHQLFVGNLPHDIDESKLKEFFMTYGNVVKLSINTKILDETLPNFGFVTFDDSNPVQRILEEKVEGPIMFQGEVRLNVQRKKTRAVREQETRGRGHDRQDMKRNDREPEGSRGIVESGKMRERDGKGPPSQTGKPHLSSVNKGGRDGEPGVMNNRRIVQYPDSHQLFVGNLPHDIDESKLKEFFMTYGNVVKLSINTKILDETLPNFGFVTFDDSNPVQRILEEKVEGPIMFQGEVRLNVQRKKTRAVREQETRGRGHDRQDMKRNDREPEGSRGIVESGKMRERDGKGPPSQTGKPHLSSVNKGGRDGEPGVMNNRRIVQYPDSHQLFVGNLPHDIDESKLKEFFMTYGNVVKLSINTKILDETLPNFGFVTFDDSNPVQRILEEKVEGPIMFQGEVHLNVQRKKTRAVREQETRGRGHDPQDMKRNDRGPEGSRGIVESRMMRERDGKGPPSQTGKPHLSSVNKGGRDGEPGVMNNRRIDQYPDSHQLFVGNLPHDIDESKLKEFFMTYGNVVKLSINTKIFDETLPNFGFVTFDDSNPVQRILEEKVEGPIMFQGEVRLNVQEKKTRVVRKQETRGRGRDHQDMKRNDQGPGGSRGIVESGKMRERDDKGPPSQTGKPHLSSVNKAGGRDGEPGVKNNRRIVQYPDSHQLFVGNLPHDIDESELKEFFMTYGNVVKLWINTKGVGRKLSNYGFVVFDNSDPVQRILEEKVEGPIMFQGEVRLNVQEKKTRAVREQETRGRGHDPQDMKRNDQGPGGSRGIVESGKMHERDDKGPPSQTGKPHLSSVNKGGRDGEPGVKNNRRIVQYPDSHQLFVGNLPHDIDESELKEFFMTYGNVVKLWINTKGVGRKLSNYGFVVFDNSDPVQRILEEKVEGPIMFQGEVRLNVQRKKTRVVREQETRDGARDRQDMKRNDQGPGGSRGIVESGMMPEREGKGPPSQTGKPHLSSVNKGGRDGEPGDMDNKHIVQYPDSHQLFVGNLPHDIDESELKEFFMTYGNVVKLWINPKGIGRKSPNFGFVAFDDSDPVQRILEEKLEGPIMFRGEVSLNVEEMKTKPVRERETRPPRVGMAPKLSMGSGKGPGG
ncbi:uncharacterized protein LOC114457939 isoform X1 [Gouania willdenowi]|uniref:uncharacterized protein LOC114457939 isoform X1 n=2 Tax=Gouania willdenowi TaxID=441366 RepID=UPI0010560A43|nr:uncharacterized protein LOC114457939 isoform X1 [Gouania willdenowi]XP_028295907.1 uncharacterized protein LOC114457939 isoform X1 [Gouania willdenowi]